MIDRRNLLAGAAGLAATQTLGATSANAARASSGHPYDYLLIAVPQGTGRRAGLEPFLAHLKGAGAAAVKAVGGELFGAFTPLIGWTSEQVAVMIRWPELAPDRERAINTIIHHPSVASVERSTLAPTTRPRPTDRPLTRGIYTHRWFTIHARNFDEFVTLSADAWPDFERDFATKVFGLFRAEPTASEQEAGQLRMLLNTQYDSHAVWEASRAPSAKAAGNFRRRADLTITTRVVSLRFVPIG